MEGFSAAYPAFASLLAVVRHRNPRVGSWHKSVSVSQQQQRWLPLGMANWRHFDYSREALFYPTWWTECAEEGIVILLPYEGTINTPAARAWGKEWGAARD